ncbi:MAG: hypothetical protein L0099_07740 [Acidobacteria bacterium]|nr:hypothetical protein [Acidobacteriota bacterium]
MRNALLLPVLVICATATLAQEAAAPGLLPAQFAGWSKQLPAQSGRDANQADAAQPALLREYGFTDFESAAYVRDQRRMAVRAARFRDTSGAYGAFTFYKDPGMLYEDIGNQAGAAGQHVLFYRGNVLVNVMLDRVTTMSAADLRELAAALPQPSSRDATSPPSLPTYLPKDSYVRNSARYVVGPVGLAAVEAPLPGSLVDFSLGPEIVLGKYQTASGEATMMLVSYPTPQIATERLDLIQQKAAQASAAHGAANLKTEVQAGISVKRTGPLVVLVTAPASAPEAKVLLAAVNYDADVTWNEYTPGARDNIGSLLIVVFTLIGLILAAALLSGVAFGGLRLLLKRLYPDKVFDRPKDMEIIQLNLRERSATANPANHEALANPLDTEALARGKTVE